MHRPIKLSATNKDFSRFGGLVLIRDLLASSGATEFVLHCLPTAVRGQRKSIKKFEDMVLGLSAGAECLDDMEELGRDPGFREVCGSVYSAKTYGDALREFSHLQTKELNFGLASYAYRLRGTVPKAANSITFDFDSTVNHQYGRKMEGVKVNRDGKLCLDSLQVYDEFGLQYANVVREGATPTFVGAPELVHQIFKAMPKSADFADLRRFVRADSGLCGFKFFRACFAANAGFAVAMRANMYKPMIRRIQEWLPQNANDTSRVIFRDGRECELGETVYHPKDFPRAMRVVIARARKDDAQPSLFRTENYDYFAVISNIGAHEMSAENLVKFYRQRGESENYIKEAKYGFDLKHYPCLKLDANRAYGVIAGFAYNLLRILSLNINPDRVRLSKAIRNSLISLPIQIVRHAREVTFKFMSHHYQEVTRWQKHMLQQFRSAKSATSPPRNWAGAL